MTETSGARPAVRIDMTWSGEGLRFEGGAEGSPPVVVDGDGDGGASPMQMFLLGVMGCTAADVLDILGKMRVSVEALEVSAEAERAPEPPRRYTRIRLRYEVEGPSPGEEEKVRRAVALSHETYCSAIPSLREDIQVDTEVHLR